MKEGCHVRMNVIFTLQIEGQTERACQPGVSGVSVQWIYYAKDNSIVQAPCQIPSLFNGTRQVVYGFVPNCTQVITILNILVIIFWVNSHIPRFPFYF